MGTPYDMCLIVVCKMCYKVGARKKCGVTFLTQAMTGKEMSKKGLQWHQHDTEQGLVVGGWDVRVLTNEIYKSITLK